MEVLLLFLIVFLTGICLIYTLIYILVGLWRTEKYSDGETSRAKTEDELYREIMIDAMTSYGAQAEPCPHCGKITPQYPGARDTLCLYCDKIINGDKDE